SNPVFIQHKNLEVILKRLKKVLIAVLFLTMLSGTAFADSLDIGFDSDQNSVNSRTLSVRADKEISAIYFSAEYNKSKVADIIATDDGFIRVGFDPKITDKWHLWFYGEFGFNNMMGINIENFLGGGPKYIITSGPNHKLSASFGLLYHYQELSDNTEDKIGRLSTRIKGFYHIKDFEFSSVAGHQPNISDLDDDYILYGEAVIVWKMRENIRMKYIITDEYRSVFEKDKRNHLSQGIYWSFDI
ncbi:MAG: DUF481 domain-containing protein, partial [Candidatus Peribacteraceae bacterium]|nr:DUF481 domain-containing protein [Candidatus Peribacteraceae bacterium]